MQDEFAELSRKAQALLNSNRLSEAREVFIRLCDLDGNNSRVWGMLGDLHSQLDDPDRAVNCLERAIELDPAGTAWLASLAGVLLASGNKVVASEYCSKAIATGPDTIEHWRQLGDISARLEMFAETEQCCREIIARDAASPQAHLFLGIALQRQSRLEEAEAAIQAALRISPDNANAYYHLGIVQQSMHRFGDAAQNYRRALDFGCEPASALYNLSSALQRAGDLKAALECGFEALDTNPGNLKYRQNFVRLLRALTPVQVSSDMREEIVRCFGVKGLDAAELMKPGMTLLFQNPLLQQLLLLAGNRDEDKIKAGILAGDYRELFQDAMLKALLTHTKIASLEFERLSGILRKIALDWVSEPPGSLPGGLFDNDGSMLIALASQFFNTEYAVLVDSLEAAKVDKLVSGISERIDAEAVSDSALLYPLVVVCMYQPLYTRSWARTLLESRQPDGGDLFSALLKTQLFDHAEERRIMDTIKSITPISDEVSILVRDQYEGSPYPRWTSVTIHTPVSYRKDTGSQFHGFNPPDFGDAGLDVLIAGCGTGRHAIMTATRIQDAEVLAIDLSLASLAFGVRSAHELGISNITFAQADILELGTLNRRFHIIETSGVLHHMQHPEKGLQVLVDLLQDDGLIHIGLYSKLARRAVTAARNYITESGLEPTPEGIRQARKDLAEMDVNHPAHSVTRFRDYFTSSECRDLLFHVHERQYRLDEIRMLLEDSGLVFIGFIFSDPQVAVDYKAQFPEDLNMSNLENWEAFENKHPDAFADMYQFTCQKGRG